MASSRALSITSSSMYVYVILTIALMVCCSQLPSLQFAEAFTIRVNSRPLNCLQKCGSGKCRVCQTCVQKALFGKFVFQCSSCMDDWILRKVDTNEAIRLPESNSCWANCSAAIGDRVRGCTQKCIQDGVSPDCANGFASQQRACVIDKCGNKVIAPGITECAKAFQKNGLKTVFDKCQRRKSSDFRNCLLTCNPVGPSLVRHVRTLAPSQVP